MSRFLLIILCLPTFNKPAELLKSMEINSSMVSELRNNSQDGHVDHQEAGNKKQLYLRLDQDNEGLMLACNTSVDSSRIDRLLISISAKSPSGNYFNFTKSNRT